MRPIGHRLETRDNNLNFIRAAAAVAVLVSHAWPISLGPGAVEPLERMTGYSLGHIAVLVFFAASGFLIAASWYRRPSAAPFLIARTARLVPGLAVSILLVTFVMGPIVTTLDASVYLSDPQTWSFVARNLLLVYPKYTLPGVFETNPNVTVAGSIWTLAYEVACYCGVLFAGLAGIFARRTLATLLIAVWWGLSASAAVFEVRTFHQLDMFLVLSQPFALGVLAFLWRDRVPVGWPVLAGAILMAAILRDSAIYRPLLVFCVAYGTLWLAVLPSRLMAAYNRVGDYSYGIYVYAYPLQGLVIWAFGNMSPPLNVALSLPPTVLAAVLSWRYVEAPALRRARTLIGDEGRDARQLPRIARTG